MNKTITAHFVVMNEERWLFFAIKSVIDYVDKVIIFDTGSTDHSCDIIRWFMEQESYSKKIIFEEKGRVNRKEFVKLRDEQIKLTETDYFMVVDGDEVYTNDTLEYIIKTISSDESIQIGIIPFVCCAGDIYHYRDPRRELYTHGDYTGALTMRVISMSIPGIHCGSEDGLWDGYYDIDGNEVSLKNGFKGFVAEKKGFLHMSFLQRSASRKKDFLVGWPSGRFGKMIKYGTWDNKFSRDYTYPEALYEREYPTYVCNPWKHVCNPILLLLQLIKNLKKIVVPMEFVHDLELYNL